MENENQDPGHVDTCECASFVDGDVISLGSAEVTDGRGRVLTAIFEAEIITGEPGERLERAQAAAIRDVLAYLASQSGESEDAGGVDNSS